MSLHHAHTGPVAGCWCTQAAGWHRDHGYRPAGHIEELNAVANFVNAGHNVLINDRADVAGMESFLGQIDG